MGGGARANRAGSDERGDAELVLAARQGSADAFATLYHRHAGATRRALSDNVHDPERQRDLLQETFTRALAKLDSLREPGQFRPWLLQIARNAAIDDLRRRMQARLEPIEEEQFAAADDVSPDVAAEVSALAAAIRSGLAVLSPRDAAAVSMAVHLGFGPTEIAAALGISYGNAKVVLHRARARLRDALEQQELLEAAALDP